VTSPLTDKTVLVIEDNPLNLKLIHALLKLHNCTVLQATDAEIGIETAVRDRPDIILMDIHLPAMDGLTAASALGHSPRTSSIPIIAVTSCAMEGDAERAVAAGCCGYITKPINTRTFIDQIIQFLPTVQP
jgi:CheY-like chemotaxis protein